MEVIKNKRILALVGIGGLILGCFLPYFKITILGFTDSISLFGYWEGKIIFVLALANALFIFQDFIEKYVPQLFNNWVGNVVKKANNPKYALIPTILVAAFAIILIFRLDVDSQFIKYGIGFWVIWIGIIALIGHAIFYKRQNVQPVQSQMQQPVQSQMQEPVQSQMQEPVQSQMQEPVQPQMQQPVQPQMQQPVQPQMQQPVQPQMQEPVQPQFTSAKKMCPQCGNQVDANVEICPACGNRI